MRQLRKNAGFTATAIIQPGPTNFFSLVVRTSQKQESVFLAAAAAIRQINPALSTAEPISMSDRINHSPGRLSAPVGRVAGGRVRRPGAAARHRWAVRGDRPMRWGSGRGKSACGSHWGRSRERCIA